MRPWEPMSTAEKRRYDRQAYAHSCSTAQHSTEYFFFLFQKRARPERSFALQVVRRKKENTQRRHCSQRSTPELKPVVDVFLEQEKSRKKKSGTKRWENNQEQKFILCQGILSKQACWCYIKVDDDEYKEENDAIVL